MSEQIGGLVDAYFDSLREIEDKAQQVLEGNVEQPSYTQLLVLDQNKRVQKLSSEVSELIREDCRPDFDAPRFIGEAADVLYSLEVMVASQGLRIARVVNLLASDCTSHNPELQMPNELPTDKATLWGMLGAAEKQVVAEDSLGGLNEERFLGAVTATATLTNALLVGRGMTIGPVIEELVFRNRTSQHKDKLRKLNCDANGRME